jgi:hemoglobin
MNPAKEPMSLFRKLGFAAVNKVVEHFYSRVLDDDELRPFFAHTDMQELSRHQAAFLAMVLGGTDHYGGRSIRSAHAGRGIGNHHFDKVAGHLQAALENAGLAAPDVAQVLTTVGSLRKDVVGTPA